MQKKLIESNLPIKEISKASTKEKTIRHGHISTLHIWWTRKPLASSRATSYAALIPAPKDDSEWSKIKQFIIELSKWENSFNPEIIEKAKKDILSFNDGKPLKVLDPFSGGGSIPLECLRLGLETYANDYNPVAVLILKCTLEYPQKYGKPGEIVVEEENFGKREKKKIKVKNLLLEDVKKWGNWVLEEAKKEIGRFYPKEPDGSIPVGYYWMRTIKCQNPACVADIPLTANFWLAKKENKRIALKPYINDGKVEFEIVGQDKPFPRDFNPERGTVSRAIATCLVCGSVIKDDKVRKLFQEGRSGQRMVAVVLHHPKRQGKFYRLADKRDLELFKQAEEYLEEKRNKLMEEWGIDPVPDEEMNTEDPTTVAGRGYGITKWGDLFNSRQKLALITFTEKVRLAYEKMLEEGYDKEYAKAVVSYLGLTINNIAEKNNSISRWANTKETIAGCFSRQALPMVWDYFESNPFSGSTGNWLNSLEYNLKVIEHSGRTDDLFTTFTQSSDIYPSEEEEEEEEI